MYYPRGGIFFFPHLFHPEGNKSIPNFLPLVGLLHGKLPLVQFYRKLEVCTSVHTTVLPTPTLPPPDPAGVLRFPCQSSSPGKPVYTTELSPGGQGGWASEGGKLPHPGSLCSRDVCSWPRLACHTPSPRSDMAYSASGKGTVDRYGQYTPRILGLWVGWCFFQVTSLPPCNGECATWLITCFSQLQVQWWQEGGPWGPTEAGRRASPT